MSAEGAACNKADLHSTLACASGDHSLNILTSPASARHPLLWQGGEVGCHLAHGLLKCTGMPAPLLHQLLSAACYSEAWLPAHPLQLTPSLLCMASKGNACYKVPQTTPYPGV